MGKETSTRDDRRILTVLMRLIILVLAGLALTWVTCGGTATPPVGERSWPSLPCAAIPTRFVLDDPECADKLLRAMNVTKVWISGPIASATCPADSQTPGTPSPG